MGVPAFFKYLLNKYGNTTIDCASVDPEDHSVDLTAANPNGVEIDNLYLDMNGIIHPCCHPEDQAAPPTEEAMMKAITTYIDRLFAIARPRKVLYMAIDGVAPRAKMNQQRARRFRAAQEAELEYSTKLAAANSVRSGGAGLAGEHEVNIQKAWDSNVITPGTPFMAKVAATLHYYVADRLTNHPAWANLRVIISDSSVPGEGEHKIIEFVRRQRTLASYNPNTSHCIYGLDADLIMLALATHEPHFYVLREVVFFGGKHRSLCLSCYNTGHKRDRCPYVNPDAASSAGIAKRPKAEKPFQFLSVPILRVQLEREFTSLQHVLADAGFAYDFERCIDDFVFMCFFVGNDFLPHLPVLQINEKAIDRMIELYKQLLPSMGGYIAEDGDLNLRRVSMMLDGLSKVEDQILMQRARTNLRREAVAKYGKSRECCDGCRGCICRIAISRRRSGGSEPCHRCGCVSCSPDDVAPDPVMAEALAKIDEKLGVTPKDHARTNNAVENARAADDLAERLFAEDTTTTTIVHGDGDDTTDALDADAADDVEEAPDTADAAFSVVYAEAADRAIRARQEYAAQQADPDEYHDAVQLGIPGWRERYYHYKFGVPLEDETVLKDVRENYIAGLCWVMKYYYQGCVSWNWYYRYHYAPFSQELVRGMDEIAAKGIHFDLGTPFRPFTQLMAVLPPASAHALPKPYAALMTDADSPLRGSYPTDFGIDPNGEKMPWKFVVLLPFMDQEKLVSAVQSVESELTPGEKRRNSPSAEVVACRLPTSEPLAKGSSAAAVAAMANLCKLQYTQPALLESADTLLSHPDYSSSQYSADLAPQAAPLSAFMSSGVIAGQVLPWSVLPKFARRLTCPYDTALILQPNRAVFSLFILPGKPDTYSVGLLPNVTMPVLTASQMRHSVKRDRTFYEGQNHSSTRSVNDMDRSNRGGFRRNDGAPPCFDFQAGRCTRGDSCRFSHQAAQPQAARPLVAPQVAAYITQWRSTWNAEQTDWYNNMEKQWTPLQMAAWQNQMYNMGSQTAQNQQQQRQ
jgi:5'-3' exoribonuclease 2